jgi:hypothetical protein
MILPLLGPDALSTGLIWVGAAILLGLILDVAGPALLLVLGLVWTAGVVAALGAVGGAAAPSMLLGPILMASVAWLAWDRAGRPQISVPLPQGRLPHLPRLPGFAAPPSATVIDARPRLPRHPASAPLADRPARARDAAHRHVSAALHGAGSRAGLP